MGTTTKESKKESNGLSIIISILALAISIVTIVLFFIKVKPNCVVDANTFESTIVALIGVMVTLLVGYQIYEAVEMKMKIKELDELQRKTEVTQQDLENEKNKMQEQRCMLMYHVFYNAEDREVDAFLRLHESLLYSLSTETIHDDMKWYFDDLKNAMCWVDAETIGKCEFEGDLLEKIEKFKYLYKSNSVYIKKHENYFIIKDFYEEIMEKFEKRLENIRDGKMVSPYEIDQVIK